MNSNKLPVGKAAEISERIVLFPRILSEDSSASMYSLLDESGYFEVADQVSESDIRAALGKDPRCLTEWLQYSEDKRTSSGWYFIQNDEGCYEIGYFGDGSDRKNRVQYENEIEACASFIEHELEDMRRLWGEGKKKGSDLNI